MILSSYHEISIVNGRKAIKADGEKNITMSRDASRCRCYLKRNLIALSAYKLVSLLYVKKITRTPLFICGLLHIYYIIKQYVNRKTRCGFFLSFSLKLDTHSKVFFKLVRHYRSLNSKCNVSRLAYKHLSTENWFINGSIQISL